jgi:hypothetical protein
VGVVEQYGVAIVALWREALGIDDQQFLARLRRGEAIACCVSHPPPEARGWFSKERRRIE